MLSEPYDLLDVKSCKAMLCVSLLFQACFSWEIKNDCTSATNYRDLRRIVYQAGQIKM
jgi:hypothetical protein